MFFNVIISYSFTTARPRPSQRKTWLTPSWINEIYLPHFTHFRHITVYDLSPLDLWYWCNIYIQLFSFRIWCLSQWFQAINVLNLNLLQQIEMWLCHVYFHHYHTMWSTTHAYYVILSKTFHSYFSTWRISLSLHTLLELLLNIKGSRDLD